jgi:hypothetical protein
MAVGVPQANPAQGNPQVLYRRGTQAWSVGTGVPPIIEPPHDDAFIPNQPSSKQEAAFMDWFSELAYPWRAENSGSQQAPQVLFRKAPND